MHKFTFLIILFLYFTYCSAKIKIHLKVASRRSGVKVVFQGSDNKLITDKEISIFNLTDASLKRGVRKELGKEPDDVYLKDPTSYGNLYQKYNWTEVKRKVFVKSVAISDIINENVDLVFHNYFNNTTKKFKRKIDEFINMENTITSTWSRNGLLNEDIVYNISVAFPEKLFSYDNNWRNKTLRMIASPIGLRNYGYVNIGPGKGVTMKLSAKKTILLFKITYIATITGQVVCNCAHEYGKYHFWAPSTSAIMKAAKLNNELITTEIIEVKCYTDPRLDLYDISNE